MELILNEKTQNSKKNNPSKLVYKLNINPVRITAWMGDIFSDQYDLKFHLKI